MMTARSSDSYVATAFRSARLLTSAGSRPAGLKSSTNSMSSLLARRLATFETSHLRLGHPENLSQPLLGELVVNAIPHSGHAPLEREQRQLQPISPGPRRSRTDGSSRTTA